MIIQKGIRQLFLDDEGIESIKGMKMVVNKPTKHPDNPIIKPDTAWENQCQLYGTVLYDEGLFKMYYLTIPKNRGSKPLDMGNGHFRSPHTTLAAYAISKDGVHWEKPSLGQFPYDGDKNNNLLNIGQHNCEGIAVLHEPNDPKPKHCWKAFYWDHGSGGFEMRDGKPFCMEGSEDGIHVSFSPDGLHWTPYEDNPVIKRYCDTNQNTVYDPKLEKYVAFSRFGFGRRLARTESNDFMHWSEPQLVLECDADDGEGTQIYGAGVDLYEGLYLAMIWIYREGIDGKIDTQLSCSRDGIDWKRVGDRETWLELGDDDSWEGGMIRSVGKIIRYNDMLYIYYCAVHGPHGGPKFPKVERKTQSCIGLVTQRIDGFVSLNAGEDAGSFTTKPFSFSDGDLHVNVDAKDGLLKVEICEETGKPIAESQTISVDSNDVIIKWNHNITYDGNVRLKFDGRKLKLYSYWFD